MSPRTTRINKEASTRAPGTTPHRVNTPTDVAGRDRTTRARRRCFVAVLALVVGALAITPSASRAATPCATTFIGANHAKWTEAANWSTGHVPTKEEIVCIPNGTTASLWFADEVPAFVSIRAIHGGSVFSNTELYFTAPASEIATEMEELAFDGTKVTVDKGSEVVVSRELFINGYAGIGGYGRLVLEPSAVGELGEVGCTTLNVNNTKIVNRGTLHVGRKYVGGMIIALFNEAQIINEGVLGMDTQVNEEEDCPPRNQNGATIFRQAPTFPYVSEAIVNTGTIETEWGKNSSTIGVPVTNDGTVVAREGSLIFSGGTVPTECSMGAWESDGAPLALTSGVFSIAPGVNLSAVEIGSGASVGGCPAPGGSKTTGLNPSSGGSTSTPGTRTSGGASAPTTGPGSERKVGDGPVAAARCVVPRLHAGATVKSTRKLLAERHCRLGRVYHVASRKVRPGHVVALRARAGARLHTDAAVAVVVAAAPSAADNHPRGS
jgi:hypothetical protein